MGKGNEEWDYAGNAPIFRHRRSGRLAVRDDSGPRVAGDDYEGDDYEGDDLAGEVDNIGDRLDRLERRLARSNERQENRNERRDNRQEKMNERMDNRQSKLRSKIRDERSDGKSNKSSKGGSKSVTWGPAMQSGEVTEITGAGLSKSIETRIENYDWFKIEDLTFEGSTDTLARVKQIWVGGRIVWNNDVGVPVSLFGPTSTMRKILGNTPVLRGGLRIKVELVTGSGAADAKKTVLVTFIGKGGHSQKRC